MGEYLIMARIVYIVFKDKKFAPGFIDFMEMKFPEFEHVFFIESEDGDIKPTVDAKIISIISYKQLFQKSGCYNNYIKSADKIIFTGVFSIDLALSYLNFVPDILTKTYFQFWGGDYCRYAKKGKGLKGRILGALRNRCFSKCGGLIFLTESEEKTFNQLTGAKNRVFVAPMPISPNKMIDYSTYSSKYNDNVIRIVLGNSASETNCHEEALKLLKKHLQGDFLIICPLSYGNRVEYREHIINLGKELFGTRFEVVTDYMERAEYVQMLANCDVGFFYNNRQQALGNINILLNLGKTVYIRKDTSMWEYYEKEGYHLKSTDEFEENGLDLIEPSYLEENKTRKTSQMKLEKAISSWKEVFECK